MNTMKNIFFDKPKDCRIKDGWEDAGKEGKCYGFVEIQQKWAIVLWDGEEEPDLFKAGALSTKSNTWVDLLTEVAKENIE